MSHPFLSMTTRLTPTMATRDLRRRISEGEWSPGEQLPTFSQMQEHYGITSVRGIQDVLAPLRAEGVIEGRQGAGTYVVKMPDLAVLDRENARFALDAIEHDLEVIEAFKARVLRSLQTAREHLDLADSRPESCPDGATTAG